MVETFLLPLGPRLAEAAGARPGVRVLDVAAGTGNASIPAARAGADVTASDLTPELLDAGRATAEAEGLEARLGDGRRRAPAVRGRVVRRRDVLDRRDVRAAPPGGRRRARARLPSRRDDRAAELDARGHARPRCSRRSGRSRRRRLPAPSRRRCGAARTTCAGCSAAASRGSASSATSSRSPPSSTPATTASTSRRRYGPAIAARANAERTGRAAEFDAALDAFCEEWNRGTPEQARFEKEYLLAVGTRAEA